MGRALVTGITGQTGSYLGEMLVAEGWEVHGLVRAADAAAATLSTTQPSVQLHTGDLADDEALARLVDDVEPDAIFNLGGQSSVARSWELPVETARITALPVAVLLEAAWRWQQRRQAPVAFVQASSAEVFGNPTESPQTERTPILPANPYGAAKAYGHELVEVYRERGLAASSCILFNHESPRRPATFVTRKITLAAARISLGLQERLTLGNLDARRDWGWAPDYARALELAAAEPGTYVIATGRAHSVHDFVRVAFESAGVEDWADRVDSDSSFARQGDAAEQVGDATRARERLGWAPTMDFEQIVTAMVQADLAAESDAH